MFEFEFISNFFFFFVVLVSSTRTKKKTCLASTKYACLNLFVARLVSNLRIFSIKVDDKCIYLML